MQNENKRGRKKYEKAERKRLLKMSTRAYDNDPRIQAELVREEQAKAAAKQAKKDANAAKWAIINEQKAAEEEAARQKVEEEKQKVIAEKEQKRLAKA